MQTSVLSGPKVIIKQVLPFLSRIQNQSVLAIGTSFYIFFSLLLLFPTNTSGKKGRIMVSFTCSFDLSIRFIIGHKMAIINIVKFVIVHLYLFIFSSRRWRDDLVGF